MADCSRRPLSSPHRTPDAVVAQIAELLQEKKLPLLAANLAQDALGRDDSAITLFDDGGEHPLGRAPKLELARKLVAHVAGMLPARK